jgi:hypothetical protein
LVGPGRRRSGEGGQQVTGTWRGTMRSVWKARHQGGGSQVGPGENHRPQMAGARRHPGAGDPGSAPRLMREEPGSGAGLSLSEGGTARSPGRQQLCARCWSPVQEFPDWRRIPKSPASATRAPQSGGRAPQHRARARRAASRRAAHALRHWLQGRPALAPPRSCRPLPT